MEDETYHQYYVVEFVKRYYDEADNANISDTLACQRVSEYINGLAENYQVTDVKGNLKYLTISTDETTSESESETDAQTETDSDSENNDSENSGTEE